jgi:hypothetical protein
MPDEYALLCITLVVCTAVVEVCIVPTPKLHYTVMLTHITRAGTLTQIHT